MAIAACSSEETPDAGSQSLTGVVVDVDSEGLGDVRRFTLRSEGRNLAVHLDEETDLAFPAGHLNEHLATADPVRVELIRRNGKLFALSIADA